MESKIINQSRFVSGLSDFPKEGLDPYVYQDGISIDHRHDPRAITLLPKTIKESGSIVTDLPKWATTYPLTLDTYIYGNIGNIYKRTTTPTYTLLRTAPTSHGNGLFYYPEDDYLYYTTDNAIGRYGPISLSSPQFVDDFLKAQGGVPTNTNSLQLLSASSQYATAANAASLQITGDISLGAYINPTTLPTVGNSMTIVAKFDESGTTRSYRFGIGAVSGYFGGGTDGALTISVNTTDAPIDSACTGTAGTQILSATNVSFASGQIIIIHQTQGTNAGQWERNTIQGYTAGTITLGTALIGTYTTGAQVIVIKQYTNVTVNNGITWKPKSWNGTTGGILVFLASGTFTNNGTVFGDGLGFRGSTLTADGEGSNSAKDSSLTGNTGGSGGGGGLGDNANQNSRGGAGGGNGASGTTNSVAVAGIQVSSSDLTTMEFGGAGGSAGYTSGGAGGGSNGGGIIFINAVTFVNNSSITSLGLAGSAANPAQNAGGGGGGAGGSILIKAQTATLGTLTATGGAGGASGGSGSAGGNGGTGRIVLDYLTSLVAGTTNPTINTIQDSSLVTTTTYQLQFSVSTNGTSFETLSQTANLTVSTWQQVAISWASASSTATFFLNATSLGTATGTRTAIHSNASLLSIGANKGASTFGNFFNGLIDEVMVISAQESSSFWNTALTNQIAANTSGLQAYYQLNNAATDATANANNLTLINAPSYSASVPFAGATTRLDIDQTQTGTGNTYTLPTSISEGANDRISFTPSRDPQKSIQVSIAAVGTGNWTITIHDSANHLITSLTVANASLHTGNYEFTFATPWRTLTNFTNTYHAHFTSTVADGTINVGTASNLTTAGFTTYFSFLITDTAWHPISQMLNQMVVGNERYVAVFNGLPASYNPNSLVLPAGYRVRCFALWNEYLAIGVMRGTNMTDFDSGRIYFWDGSALTFNFFIDVPEGGVNALLSKGSSLYAWCGYSGYLFQYQAGLEGDKIKRIPHILESDTVEIYPGAVTLWRTLVRFGVAGASTSTSINRGVYSWGSFLTMGYFQQLYRESLSFDYPISTGNYGSTVTIGLTTPVQNKLLIGWQDGIAFGVDYVSPSNAPASLGSMSLLLSDDEQVYKQKSGLTLVAQHLPLLSGESIQVKAATDRGTYQVSGFNSTVGSTKTAIIIPGQLYNEYQVGADLATTGTTSPTITSLAFERDPQSGSIKLQTQ